MAADGPDSAVKDLLEKSDELRRKADDLLVEFNNLSEKIKQLERAATKALQKSDEADQTTRPPDRTRSG